MSNRSLIAPVLLLLVLGLSLPVALLAGEPSAEEEMKIAALLGEFEGMSEERLEALPARDIEPFVLPPNGADVMRVRLQETYDIDGIGRDTVELTGWIAVKHTNARAVDGSGAEPTWENAVLDTQFVGMELEGKSDVFGRVRVTLDDSRGLPLGEVGQIELPEEAQRVLLAELGAAPQSASDTRSRATSRSTMKRGLRASRTLDVVLGNQAEVGIMPLDAGTVLELSAAARATLAAGACRAEVQVNITLLDLGIEMRTVESVGWYSLVETIPPVGETASIAIEPVRLESEGREIGTLLSGKVAFREVVRFVAFDRSPVAVDEEIRVSEVPAAAADSAPLGGMEF